MDLDAPVSIQSVGYKPEQQAATYVHADGPLMQSVLLIFFWFIGFFAATVAPLSMERTLPVLCARTVSNSPSISHRVSPEKRLFISAVTVNGGYSLHPNISVPLSNRENCSPYVCENSRVYTRFES